MPAIHRVVILGDAHITKHEEARWRGEIIPDLNALRADRFLLLGDLTSGDETGSPEAFARALGQINKLNAPWQTIFGNHDLEHRAFPSDEAVVAYLLKTMGREQPGWIIEEEAYAIIGLDNTSFRRNAVNHHEVVIDDEQLAWCEATLAALGDKPVLFATHAPAIGSGVVALAEFHVAGGNGYTNQSQLPGKLLGLARRHPNIVFWFSGHTHLGHQYRDSVTRRMGVHFVHTGTAGFHPSRDGKRHTRVLDFGPEGFRLRTFCHTLRAFDPALEHRGPRPLGELVAARSRLRRKHFHPIDPQSMEQPAPGVFEAGHRLAWLSGLEATFPLSPALGRQLHWSAHRCRVTQANAVILGGGNIAPGQPEGLPDLLRELHIPGSPILRLRCNDEPNPCGATNASHAITLPQPWEATPTVWLLPAATPAELAQAVDHFLDHCPPATPCLILSPLPPRCAGPLRLRRLEEHPAQLHWVHHGKTPASRAGMLHLHPANGLCSIHWHEGYARLEPHPLPPEYLAPPQEPVADRTFPPTKPKTGNGL